ncbi:MAG: hypothetical protein A2W90_01205 [Bacteroidetes bacterium GWF2_42_66]|nr:MAG: hypothetical protein A2W92_00625 [Bacteroidetes bacterium GWA2_42_15]OFY00997.1 MAG: hypothetical protein A2W89_14695 [Bacteroidetes bacterium GWE2_42_39]OFY41837.1 MAG: hypothetical protein A2W90_01205 [Bacteroidetes bacterium GWF2_42_66]HBL77991.1 hypothetical protein [Prolixibacteraceae bacterium]HCR90246.1 hypothetical protein [Prolixibacteraceae bacterium]
MKLQKAKDLDQILDSLLEKIENSPVQRVDAIIENSDKKYLRELQSILINDQLVYSGGGAGFVPIKILTKGIVFLNSGGYVKKRNENRIEKRNDNIKIFGVIVAALVGIITLTISILNYIDNREKMNERLDKIERQINEIKK